MRENVRPYDVRHMTGGVSYGGVPILYLEAGDVMSSGRGEWVQTHSWKETNLLKRF